MSLRRAALLALGLAACGHQPFGTDHPLPPDDTDDVVGDDTDTDDGPRDTSWDDGDTDPVDTDTDLPANEVPTCTIVAPEPGANPEVGDALLLRAQTPDPDGASSRVQVAWTSDVDGLLGNTNPDSAGASRVTVRTLSFGPHTLTLAAEDERGGTCTATVDVLVGTPPTASLTAPADGSVVAAGAALEFRGNARDGATGPRMLDVVLSSSVDGELWRGDGGPISVTTSTLSRGDHVITLTVTDGDGLTAEDALALHVDAVPTAPAIAISPEDPFTGDDLVGELVTASTDADGDPITYTWAWTVDGAPTAYTDTVPASATTRDQVWTLTVTPSDGTLAGPPAVASLVIGNTPAVGSLDAVTLRVIPAGARIASSIVLDPVPLHVDDTLVAEVQESWTDADGDPAGHRFEWYKDAGSGAWIQIAGETTDTLVGLWSKGDRIMVRVQPVDGADPYLVLGGWKSASITCENSVPTVPGIELSPADPVEGVDDLVCAVTVASTDPDPGDAVTYDVTWTLNGAPAPAGALLSHALPGDTVDATQIAAGEVWTCSVTASDPASTSAPAEASVEVTAP